MRLYAVDVTIVVAPVSLMIDRSVFNGRRNSEQKPVALRMVGAGLFELIADFEAGLGILLRVSDTAGHC